MITRSYTKEFVNLEGLSNYLAITMGKIEVAEIRYRLWLYFRFEKTRSIRMYWQRKFTSASHHRVGNKPTFIAHPILINLASTLSGFCLNAKGNLDGGGKKRLLCPWLLDCEDPRTGGSSLMHIMRIFSSLCLFLRDKFVRADLEAPTC